MRRYRPELEHPLLPENELRELIQRYQQHDDVQAVERIIFHNERMVFTLAMRYCRVGVTGDTQIEDLQQLGRIGLIKAIKRFNCAKHEAKFGTYAFWWVRQEIRRQGIRQGQSVHLSYAATERRGAVGKARGKLSQALGREPTVAELAGATGMDAASIVELRASVLSLDAEENHEYVTMLERLPDPGVDVESDAGERHEAARMLAHMGKLSAKHRTILVRRYGLAGGKAETLDSIARSMSMTRENVRLLEKQALQLMRTSMKPS